MDALVEPINTQQQLQVVALIRQKFPVFRFRFRLARVKAVALWLAVHFPEPIWNLSLDFLQMRPIGAEKDIFFPFFQISRKDSFQPVCPAQRPAQGVQIPLAGFLHALGQQRVDALLVAAQLVLILEHRGHIPGSGQNPPGDGLTQGHFAGNTELTLHDEQLLRHVPAVVKIPDGGCRQAQNSRLRIPVQQPLYTRAPAVGATAVKFVQNDVLRPQLPQRLLRKPQELRVGHELHIGERTIRAAPLVFKDVVVGRQPQEPGIRVILDELKSEKALSSAGGVDHGGTAAGFQHRKYRFVGCSVVFVKLQARRPFL